MNKKGTLEYLRNKTKVAEMILGTLILLTGGYLLFVLPQVEGYLIGKVVLVLLAIPLGIVGLKKNNKILTGLALFVFIYAYGIAETKSMKFKRTQATIEVESDQTAIKGQAIYEQLCVQCHGKDGKLGAAGSKDLSVSNLSEAEKKEIITNGKGLMRGFKNDLTEDQINDVAGYVETLKK